MSWWLRSVVCLAALHFAACSPEETRKFTTGDKESLALVHDGEMGWKATVVNVGGQAEQSGIKLGWRLLEVNGESTDRKSNYWMISKLGERPLELKYRRPFEADKPCTPDARNTLYRAVGEGKVKDVHEVLEDFKCNLNSKMEGEELPLMHLAAKVGDMAKIRTLQQYGAKIDDSFEGVRPLHIAVKGLKAYAAHWLVTLGADTSSTDVDGWPVPHQAAKVCATEVMKVFRMKGVDIYQSVNGKTPEEIARDNCETPDFPDMMARWSKEKKEKDADKFTSMLKGAEL